MMTFRFASCCGLLVLTTSFATAQTTPQICSDGQCIQVASQNLELFGSSRKPYGGVARGPRTDAQIDQIAARLATELDLEVIVFEEINTASDEWAKLKSKLASHGYRFFEGTTSARHQFVALAWDAEEVELLDGSAQQLDVRDSFDLGGGCEETGLRKPVAGRFKAGAFDFWVVGVHLKSRSGTESCTKRIRTEQCKDLVQKLEALEATSGESDFVIVGDFNHQPNHESFQPLVDAGFTCQMRFLMDESAEGSYVKNGDLNESADLIDHVWLRYGQTKEVVRRSAFALRLSSPAAAKTYIIEQSDHVPAWVSFRVDEDLDDED